MFRCPVRCRTPESVAMIRALADYKAGFLPEPGGMLDQSAWFVDAVHFLMGVVAMHEEIVMEAARHG